MGSQVLVTGAFGFVGRHVALAAARAGHEVRGVGHGSWGRAEWRTWGLSDWHHCEVTLDALVSYGGEPITIIHCAGSGSVGFSMSNPSQDFDRTVLTTRDVLEYARLHRNGARVVLPSSAGVYGEVEALPISVNSPLRPASPYGQHKLIAENLCRSYARHFAVPVVVVRLFSIFGIGLRKQLLWDACGKLAAGAAEFGGTGDETRDWLHVDDAARLLLFAGGRASVACPAINGAMGVGVSNRTVVDAIARELGSSAAASFSGASRPGDPPHFVADVSEAHALGWRAERDLAAELPAYVDWFKAGAP